MSWNITRTFRSLLTRKARPRRPYHRARLLWLELLDDRLAPAIISWNVNTSGDWNGAGYFGAQGIADRE
jgi:hypothetical protein